jgi:hypothetical protein
MAAEIYRLIPPSEQAHTFRKRIADSDDIDVAEPSHVALGLGGYMYTPAVYASGLVICPIAMTHTSMNSLSACI